MLFSIRSTKQSSKENLPSSPTSSASPITQVLPLRAKMMKHHCCSPAIQSMNSEPFVGACMPCEQFSHFSFSILLRGDQSINKPKRDICTIKCYLKAGRDLSLLISRFDCTQISVYQHGKLGSWDARSPLSSRISY